MNWKQFSTTYEKYYCTSGSTWYHRTIALKSSRLITFLSYKFKISPNTLTFLSSLFAILGMGIIVWKPYAWTAGIINLICLQFCFIIDCADGIMARLQQKNSFFGSFIDIFLDRLNNFVVFGGFGFAWIISSPSKLSLLSIVLYISAASAYILYTIASMIRGFVFTNLKGTMGKYGKTWQEKILKLPYQFMNMGVHFLLLSVAYIFGFIYQMVIFYGMLAFVLTLLMTIYLYLKDKQRSET